MLKRHELYPLLVAGASIGLLVAAGSPAKAADGEPAAGSVLVVAAAPEDRQITFDPAEPVLGDEFVITVSGWPATCTSVEVHQLDGSPGEPDEGDVISSWGTILLVDGAGSTTAVARGSDEYNLQVAGPSEQCGEPYYTPDFGFLAPPSPPSLAGVIQALLVPDSFEIIQVDASGWPMECEVLRVDIYQGGGAVRLGQLELDAGEGSLTGPASLLSNFDESSEYDVGAYTAEDDESGDPVTGPADVCGGVATTTLETFEGWTPPVPAPTTDGSGSIPSSSQVVTPPPPMMLPDTGGSDGNLALVAAATTLAGIAMLAVRHCSSGMSVE